MRRALVLLILVVALVAAPVAAATNRAGARIQHLLARQKAACHLVVRGIAAKAIGPAWRVTARVVTFGNRASASWWVQVRSGKVTPAEPLAADISAGCPGG